MKIRPATREDVPKIVQMLATDPLGKLREAYRDPLPQKYYEAFSQINSDPNQELVVIENKENKVIGTLQLSFIQYLTYQGGVRAQIEAVRVREEYRGKGIGRLLFEWAIRRARTRGAHVVQLTTDKKRPEAFRFYGKLGFVASHEGMKLHFK
ncbi:GNAT family N-acetyltransferase [Flavobacteriaceae bacterium TP-CH-4]|uniref:GNAT family N-acetyltransferase n=1 Tax=Pelagihabitans pacificus TaxID=2696054 RepID=A0A967EDK1_9FLAO|nr:GNAT family N-acetyltransferase [Pelagihabitans pacificus]NHF59418.1 GNAT family N-acetyltransferase [Pelagihabitans pacificus]